MKPYYQDDLVTLYHADCRELTIEADAVVTDPPYGMGWNTNSSRFSGGEPSSIYKRGRGREDWGDVAGDNMPFDPEPWLGYAKVILWGANHFAQRLPVGTTLVWIKRFDGGYGTFLSDAEVAWMKGGHGVYCHRDTSLMSHTQYRAHPTQKPLGLMHWCLEKTTGLVLDPFAGSGTTLVAARELGRRAVGIEIEERWCETTAKRLSQASLFGALA